MVERVKVVVLESDQSDGFHAGRHPFFAGFPKNAVDPVKYGGEAEYDGDDECRLCEHIW
jgi:hypothetical protein